MTEVMEVTSVVEKSKGQLFKEKHGYSKTLKRLMQKYGVATLGEYRKIRKERKKKVRAIQKNKHTTALAGRGSKSSSNSKKR